MKANQPELLEDIQTLFAESCVRKDRPVGCGFDRALRVEKWRIDNCQLSNCQTLREDRSRVRQGRAPQVLAAINNVVLGLWARCGYTNAAEARRHFAAHLPKAVQLILRC